MGRKHKNLVIPAPAHRDPNGLSAKSRKSAGAFKKNFKREKQRAIEKADKEEF